MRRVFTRSCRGPLASFSTALTAAAILLLPGGGTAAAADAPPAEGATAPLAMREPAHPAARQAYAARAAHLRIQALATGRLDYQQVVHVAYAPGVVNDEVLRAKAEWRQQIAARGDFTFLADYSLLTTSATVRALVPVADAGLRSTLVAQYEATLHTIGIAESATDFCVFHEAGHALQRAALQAGRSWQGGWAASHLPENPFDAALNSTALDPTSVRRLRYLTSQDEFEVRLQDLNRFHALFVAERPIMNPTDSIRALVALGLPLDFEAVRAAFAIAGRAIGREEFDACLAVAPAPVSESQIACEDARELCLLQRLVLHADPTYWPGVLAKIIFEAPGHF